MKKTIFLAFCFLLFAFCSQAQQTNRFNPDTIRTIIIDSAVNIRSHHLTAEDFIDAVLRDTGFYRAFREMKRFSFIAENRIYSYDKKNRINGKVYRKVRYSHVGSRHQTEYLAKSDSGTIYKSNGKYQLYTIEMFDYIFNGAYNSDYAKGPELPARW